MSEVREPPESYIVQDNGQFFYVTEYGDDDLEIRVEQESVVDKLGYLIVYHAITLDNRISHGAFRLYCLYHYWAHEKRKAWPTLKTIAKHLNVTRPTVIAYNKELEAAGYICRIARKSDDGDKLSSIVVLLSTSNNTGLNDAAAKIFMEERGIPLEEGQGGKKTLPGSKKVLLGGQCTDQGGKKTLPKGLTPEGLTPEGKTPPAKNLPPLEIEDSYTVTYYYKDRENVTCTGHANIGPWQIRCYACGNDVVIRSLKTPVECRCGLHEYVLTKDRPGEKKAHPAVVILRQKIGHLNQEQVNLIEGTVGTSEEDLDLWRKVISAWLQHGWYERNVSGMVERYVNKDIPGTKKKEESKAESAEPITTHTPPPPEPPEPPRKYTDEELAAWAAEAGGETIRAGPIFAGKVYDVDFPKEGTNG